MSFRIGINGFGRIGRLVTRLVAATSGPLIIAHINDPALAADEAAHLLTFDSVHGRWREEATAQGVGSSRVDLQACKLEYSIVSPK